MLYKYSQKILKEELSFISQYHHIKILSNDNTNNQLNVLFFNPKIGYEIIFYFDLNSKNSSFFKSNFTIVKLGKLSKIPLQNKIYEFYSSLPREKMELTSFLSGLKDSIDNEINNINNLSSNQIYSNEDMDQNYFYNSICNGKNIFMKTLLIHFFSVLLKVLVGYFGYSGEHNPPKFGDFEAQRHWMELTINLPANDWYTDTRDNPKNYWPLDYPPLSGYHAYLLGFILKKIRPKSVVMFYSRGYEGVNFKIVMRLFALFSDIFIYHTAVNLLVKFLFLDLKINKKSKNVPFLNKNLLGEIQINKKYYCRYYLFLFTFLVSPWLIIIDHGHYQFNNMMHGLFLYAVYFLFNEQYILAIVFYVLCVNFKQMGLYYAITFPVFVFKKLLEESKMKRIDKYIIVLFNNLMLNQKYFIYI